MDVDCADSGSATLRIASNNRAWKMFVANRKNVLLLNRENFSCAWKNVRVGVNYKSSGPQAGDVVSLELLE